MIEQGALEAIRDGRRGVHLVTQGSQVVEAVELMPVGADLFITTRHLCGDPGPTVRARNVRALERTYEEIER